MGHTGFLLFVQDDKGRTMPGTKGHLEESSHLVKGYDLPVAADKDAPFKRMDSQRTRPIILVREPSIGLRERGEDAKIKRHRKTKTRRTSSFHIRNRNAATRTNTGRPSTTFNAEYLADECEEEDFNRIDSMATNRFSTGSSRASSTASSVKTFFDDFEECLREAEYSNLDRELSVTPSRDMESIIASCKSDMERTESQIAELFGRKKKIFSVQRKATPTCGRIVDGKEKAKTL